VNPLIRTDVRRNLQRSKLLVRSAAATAGVGDRRSKARGPGIEFADFREYQPGDDFRYVDPQIFLRLGKTVVRQYTLEQQLRVTLLVDATASMATGAPPKLDMALEVAAALGMVTLAGGDQLLVGVFTEDGIAWHDRLSSLRRLDELCRWLRATVPSGSTGLHRIAALSAPRLQPLGLMIVVSDWYFEDTSAAFAVWRAADQDLIAYQIVSPEEVDPGLLGVHHTQVVDAETGDAIDASGDSETLARYRSEFLTWQGSLRDEVQGIGGRYFVTGSADDMLGTTIRLWRSKGLIT
jgi:uncharacterized protein (DUF58 family)